MMRKGHKPRQEEPLLQALLASLGEGCSASSLDVFINERTVPMRLGWEPSFCIAHGEQRLLVHVLASPEFPIYVEKAVAKLASYPKAKVLLVARDLMTERGERESRTRIFASKVASQVADRALSLGCGLLIESESTLHFVFGPGYKPRRACAHGEETGHIPKWLIKSLANSDLFSPHLSGCLRDFEKDYQRATRGKSISDARESELLLRFATDASAGDPRLFFPVDHLRTLKQYEASGANRHIRDHFFHTFNNLFLGLFILGYLARGRVAIADVDRFIKSSSGKVQLRYWESLWLLTCLFHDPAYMAEHFWPNLRFAFGVPQREDAEDEKIPEPVLAMIRDLWDGEFAGPRKELHGLYDRTVKKWLPSSVAQKGPDLFDRAMKKAYFDGSSTTHSLVSGLRLISLCRTHEKVVRPHGYDPKVAEAACYIAALCMMFHDQKCREELKSAGIRPIAFEHLPYAAVLMYVDSLQDDRRTTETTRFPDHGVLHSLAVSSDGALVTAVVCLPELKVSEWAKRIVEYESVMNWINAESEVRFEVDYRTRTQPTRTRWKSPGEPNL